MQILSSKVSNFWAFDGAETGWLRSGSLFPCHYYSSIAEAHSRRNWLITAFVCGLVEGASDAFGVESGPDICNLSEFKMEFD